MFSAASKTGSQPAVAKNYIEDVFSTYLYTGNGTFSGETNVITNNIDLATQGGMVWIKNRTSAGTDNCVSDTVRGGTSKMIRTNSTAAQTGAGSNISFQTTGFTALTSGTNTNYTGENYCSWTFRKQAKFFDIVTYTGDGVDGRSIAHNLGSIPGMIVVKCTSSSTNWPVFHRGSDTSAIVNLALNLTSADGGTSFTGGYVGGRDATTFYVSAYAGSQAAVNASGETYVAYLFAHNAGGFGTTGTDNVISCSSYTGNGSSTNGPIISLGYEPQFVMVKCATDVGNWRIYDVMRGMSLTSTSYLQPNLANAELTYTSPQGIYPNATGFQVNTTDSSANVSGQTYIYMAIRRPMKVPTDATTVFSPLVSSGEAQGTVKTTGFAIDSQWQNYRGGAAANTAFNDRLRGVSSTTTGYGNYLTSSSTGAEVTGNNTTQYWNNTGFQVPEYWAVANTVYYNLARRPGFFDVVCYTGTGSATTQTHNLGVAPELMIVKKRNGASNWHGYAQALGGSQTILLNATGGGYTDTTIWNSTAPTSSVFSLGTSGNVNGSTQRFVAYLFATCAGVSKVGSYTGNGTTQAISCGFTGGARFVLIKRTDSNSDWYVYDTARGMTTLTDPYLLLNDTAAESATLGSVTSTAGGFSLNSTILAAINVSGGSYIFLAIA